MDSYVAIGNSNLVVKVLILAFKEATFTEQTRLIISRLQNQSRISSAIEVGFVPCELGPVEGGFYVLWLFMPVEVNALETANRLVPILEQRFNISMYRTNISLVRQVQYSIGYAIKKP